MSEVINSQPNPMEKPADTSQTSGDVTILNEHFRLKYAGFWIRFWAYTIDLIILSAISGILIKPIFRVADISISNPVFFLFTPYKVTIILLMLIYFTLMTKFFKQTIGKMIMGIHVVAKDGGDLKWSTVIYRETIGRFIAKMLLVPYLLVIFMPKKEALHDIFADTYVIHEDTYEKEQHVHYVKTTNGHQLQDGSII
jgi:uncharacterized RDD family membrane protein YckC